MAGHVGKAGHALQGLAEADVVSVGPRPAEGGHAHHNQVGADLYEVFVFEAEVAHYPGAVILDYHVGDGYETKEEVSTPLRLQVQGYAVLAAVAHVEVGAAVVGVLGVFYAVGWEHVADGVDVDGGLDAYDFGAEGGHELGGVGSGPVTGEVNDPDVPERQIL